MKDKFYGKYIVTKADGTPTDPEADYFVLRLDTDPLARKAARQYAKDAARAGLEMFAKQLWDRCDRYLTRVE